ncbi:hypothetical protein AURDEDRAFT_124551 [Auricularia subglabra TFB-10046 SS5]|nr:hypothetical protein AURDEDRAFT_124551 [Auricularia subglabra TFB-10046 SS5]
MAERRLDLRFLPPVSARHLSGVGRTSSPAPLPTPESSAFMSAEERAKTRQRASQAQKEPHVIEISDSDDDDDAFIRSKLVKKNTKPSPTTSRLTLKIRLPARWAVAAGSCDEFDILPPSSINSPSGVSSNPALAFVRPKRAPMKKQASKDDADVDPATGPKARKKKEPAKKKDAAASKDKDKPSNETMEKAVPSEKPSKAPKAADAQPEFRSREFIDDSDDSLTGPPAEGGLVQNRSYLAPRPELLVPRTSSEAPRPEMPVPGRSSTVVPRACSVLREVGLTPVAETRQPEFSAARGDSEDEHLGPKPPSPIVPFKAASSRTSSAAPAAPTSRSGPVNPFEPAPSAAPVPASKSAVPPALSPYETASAALVAALAEKRKSDTGAGACEGGAKKKRKSDAGAGQARDAVPVAKDGGVVEADEAVQRRKGDADGLDPGLPAAHGTAADKSSPEELTPRSPSGDERTGAASPPPPQSTVPARAPSRAQTPVGAKENARPDGMAALLARTKLYAPSRLGMSARRSSLQRIAPLHPNRRLPPAAPPPVPVANAKRKAEEAEEEREDWDEWVREEGGGAAVVKRVWARCEEGTDGWGEWTLSQRRAYIVVINDIRREIKDVAVLELVLWKGEQVIDVRERKRATARCPVESDHEACVGRLPQVYVSNPVFATVIKAQKPVQAVFMNGGTYNCSDSSERGLSKIVGEKAGFDANHLRACMSTRYEPSFTLSATWTRGERSRSVLSLRSDSPSSERARRASSSSTIRRISLSTARKYASASRTSSSDTGALGAYTGSRPGTSYASMRARASIEMLGGVRGATASSSELYGAALDAVELTSNAKDESVDADDEMSALFADPSEDVVLEVLLSVE